MDNNNLSNRIADLLKQRGMTQRELAVKAGITEKSMAGIVSGERTPMGPTVANIANALHTTPGYLLGKEEKKEEEMTGLTTKEQERKAIQKIRKIVEELGENSYVGFAMDGVLELAEKNIRDDTAYSMKKRAEIAWERADKAEKENKNLKAETEDLKKTIEKKGTTISELNTELCNARAEAKANEIPERVCFSAFCFNFPVYIVSYVCIIFLSRFSPVWDHFCIVRPPTEHWIVSPDKIVICKATVYYCCNPHYV